MGDSKTFRSIVKRFLTYPAKCYRHCEQEASFQRLVEDEDRIVGAYVCPAGYVSRIICFAPSLDVEWFKNLLIEKFVGNVVRETEIRVATRYSWEIETKTDAHRQTAAKNPTLAPRITRQAYWSPPRARDASTQQGAFVCSNCKRFFIQNITADLKTCPRCR